MITRLALLRSRARLLGGAAALALSAGAAAAQALDETKAQDLSMEVAERMRKERDE